MICEFCEKETLTEPCTRCLTPVCGQCLEPGDCCPNCGTHEFRGYSLSAVEDEIGIKAATWPGRCHEIADAMNNKIGLGTLRYGHFTGRIDKKSLFGGLPFSRHGWIEMPDGTVVDPTRWVFECAPPYIYHGPADEYDAGGQRHRAENRRPCPEFTGKSVSVVDFGTATDHVWGLVQRNPVEGLDIHQLMWLANAPLSEWAEHAKTIVEALIAAGEGALIPIDNRRLALGQDSAGRD